MTHGSPPPDHAFWWQAVVEYSPDAVFLKNLAGRYLHINPAGAAYLGLAVDQIVGWSDAELFGAQDAAGIVREDQAVLTSGEGQHDETHLQFGPLTRIFSTHRFPYRAAGGEIVGVIGVSRDITELRAAQTRAEQASGQLQAMLERLTDACYSLDHLGHFQYMNAPAERLLGRSRADVLGRGIWEAFPQAAGSGFRAALDAAVASGQPTEFAQYSPLEDRWFEVQVSPSPDGVTLLFRDVTARRRAEAALKQTQAELERRVVERTAELERASARLRHDALHDALTGLPNRTLLLDRLERALARSGRQAKLDVALLLLNIDRFGAVNARFGPAAGDRALRTVARRLHGVLRSSDTLARLSGDEFAVLLEEDVTPDALQRVAARLSQAVGHGIDLAGQTLYLTAGMGVVRSTLEHRSAGDVLRDADLAMRHAKTQGKAVQQVFSPALHQRAQLRRTLEDDLRQVLEDQQLSVEFQPVVDLATGAMRGMEALARWNHPQHGPVPPAEFIPLAEELGLIVALDRVVLGLACAAWAGWQTAYPAVQGLTLNVNISAQHLAQPGLARDLGLILSGHGVSPHCLQLELTESSLLQLTDEVHAELMVLRRLGIRLAIDDFGTGYSSLSYLQHLPVSTLKIDRSFVSGAAHQAQIVRAIVTMAHTLGVGVVAEGIETAQQQAELRELGCDAGQGYWLSKPLTARALEQTWLAGEARFSRAAPEGQPR